MREFGRQLVSVGGDMFFLVSEQERTKEGGIGWALNVALPRAKDAPSYVPPPSRPDDPAKHLNLPPVPEKSVPTFSRKCTSVKNRQGRRRLTACHRCHLNKLDILPVKILPRYGDARRKDT